MCYKIVAVSAIFSLVLHLSSQVKFYVNFE